MKNSRNADAEVRTLTRPACSGKPWRRADPDGPQLGVDKFTDRAVMKVTSSSPASAQRASYSGQPNKSSWVREPPGAECLRKGTLHKAPRSPTSLSIPVYTKPSGFGEEGRQGSEAQPRGNRVGRLHTEPAIPPFMDSWEHLSPVGTSSTQERGQERRAADPGRSEMVQVNGGVSSQES